MKCNNCGASCDTHICPYCKSTQVNPAAQKAAQKKEADKREIEQELARLEGKKSFLQKSFGLAPSDMLNKKIKIVDREIAAIKNSESSK
tara:strand:- start:93 stop:359 length:267 start_codon:yes stop_codon:yes gene_type:complete